MRDEDLQFERKIYRMLLELAAAEESIERFLQEVLELVMEKSGARRCWIGLGPADKDTGMPAAWWTARAPDGEQPELEMRVSSTIVRDALERGEAVRTCSALVDPRYNKAESVRAQNIESVLCVPVGAGEGVIYLEGHANQRNAFAASEETVRLLSRVTAQVGWRLLRARGEAGPDPTEPYRSRMRVDEFIGRSIALQTVFADIEDLSALDSPLLLTGPTGVGKTRIARAIHNHSPRAGRPFRSINCATLTDELFASELFGHARGAFTGAESGKEGLIAACEGGTLFLDEISETSLAMQAKLLTFLEDRSYIRVGETKERRADVRILAATNVDPESPERSQKLRDDLWYRFTLHSHLPALADRPEDIPLLIEHFSRAAAKEYGWAQPSFSLRAIEAAQRAPWPGNIRELEKRVHAAVIKAHRGGKEQITSELLGLDAIPASTVEVPGIYPIELSKAQDAFKRRHVTSVLRRMEGNKKKTAETLGIARSYLYALLKSPGPDEM